MAKYKSIPKNRRQSFRRPISNQGRPSPSPPKPSLSPPKPSLSRPKPTPATRPEDWKKTGRSFPGMKGPKRPPWHKAWVHRYGSGWKSPHGPRQATRPFIKKTSSKMKIRGY